MKTERSEGGTNQEGSRGNKENNKGLGGGRLTCPKGMNVWALPARTKAKMPRTTSLSRDAMV